MITQTKVMSDYYFRGERPYIQGAMIFESFCRILRDNNVASFELKDLKFYRELNKNGQIILKMQLTEGNDFDEKLLLASMSFLVDGQEGCFYLLEDPQAKDVQRKDNEDTGSFIKEVNQTGDFSSRSSIVDVKDFESLITVLVEVNKRTHKNTLKDAVEKYGYRWVLLKNVRVDLNVQFPQEFEVTVRHVGRKKGKDGIFYSLNKLSWAIFGEEYNSLMSFAYPER